VKDDLIEQRQNKDFDSLHGTKPMPSLDIGKQVWMPDIQARGTIQGNAVKRSCYSTAQNYGKLPVKSQFRHYTIGVAQGSPKRKRLAQTIKA